VNRLEEITEGSIPSPPPNAASGTVTIPMVDTNFKETSTRPISS
jgi:hypothetical protein